MPWTCDVCNSKNADAQNVCSSCGHAICPNCQRESPPEKGDGAEPLTSLGEQAAAPPTPSLSPQPPTPPQAEPLSPPPPPPPPPPPRIAAGAAWPEPDEPAGLPVAFIALGGIVAVLVGAIALFLTLRGGCCEEPSSTATRGPDDNTTTAPAGSDSDVTNTPLPALTVVDVNVPDLFGEPDNWHPENIGKDGDMFWTGNNGPCPDGPDECPLNADVNWGIWQPELGAAGDYRVCAWIPEGLPNGKPYTANAQYLVKFADEPIAHVPVDQQATSGWADLGVYRFTAGSSEFVRLGDWTGEPWLGSQRTATAVAFDLMEWVPGGGNC